jgi:hypothetical protein
MAQLLTLTIEDCVASSVLCCTTYLLVNNSATDNFCFPEDASARTRRQRPGEQLYLVVVTLSMILEKSHPTLY